MLYNPKEADPECKWNIESTCVYGYDRLTIGLVVGEDRALVINAGLGMDPKLRTFIEGIIGTDREIICAVTHYAADHIGSAGLFDRAFVCYRDLKNRRKDNDVNHRLMLLYSFSLQNVTLTDHFRDKYLPIKDINWENIADGDNFNLGGVKVETIPLPGHTDGTTLFYIPQDKILFTGDAINADTWLLETDKEGLIDYADRLGALADDLRDPEITIYAGHINRGQEFNIIRDLAEACREVANGDTYGDPPAMTSFVFEKEMPSRRLHYHANTCVIYDRNNL